MNDWEFGQEEIRILTIFNESVLAVLFFAGKRVDRYDQKSTLSLRVHKNGLIPMYFLSKEGFQVDQRLFKQLPTHNYTRRR